MLIEASTVCTRNVDYRVKKVKLNSVNCNLYWITGTKKTRYNMLAFKIELRSMLTSKVPNKSRENLLVDARFGKAKYVYYII